LFISSSCPIRADQLVNGVKEAGEQSDCVGST
jgi:hypothetical protein